MGNKDKEQSMHHVGLQWRFEKSVSLLVFGLGGAQRGQMSLLELLNLKLVNITELGLPCMLDRYSHVR